MKLGVFTVLFGQQSFTEMLDTVVAAGLDAVELGAGGYPGKAHCNPAQLLHNDGAQKQFLHEIHRRGLTISALSAHANPLHPQKHIAQPFHDELIQAIDLAQQLGVAVVNTFSGCPGDHEGALYPNWPVAPWPHDFQEVLRWQWEEKLIPYWRDVAKYAADRQVKIALELHGGFSVHTPATLLRLREAVGDNIGANLDPSHLWWQAIDPVQAIRILGKQQAIFHFHAKDTSFEPTNMNRYGITDMQTYGNMFERAWQFRTVGFGHAIKEWADIVSALRLVGYDHVISIEHEDGLMSVGEGFSKAVAHLQQVFIREPLGEAWWI